MPRKPAHAKSKAKRRAKKHQAKRQPSRLKPLVALWARVPKSIRILGMDHDVSTVHALAFVVVLGIAVGAGYSGAQALFGAEKIAQAPSTIIQQSVDPRGVIYAEPNGGSHAYEESVAEEVYVAPVVPVVDAPEVASLPVGSQPLWLRNALDVPRPTSGPLIAIVIDDMGVDRGRSRQMWEDVPGPLTLSFMSYADSLDIQTTAAKNNGHELMLHMSMEPSSKTIDAGPNVLLRAMSDEELKSMVVWGLDRFKGYVGVNNHMGSRFTEDTHAMRVMMSEVQAHDLFFLDSRTSAKSVGRKVATELGMTFLERNVFLDNDNNVDTVLRQLEQVERLALKQGHAIAIGHPRDATIEVLKTWIPKARARGLNIVPITMLLKE